MILGGRSNCQGCGCVPGPCAPVDYTPYTYLEVSIYEGEVWAQSFITPPGGMTLTSVTMSIAGYEPLQSLGLGGGYENYPRANLYASESCDGSPSKIQPVSTFDSPTGLLTGYLAALTPPAIGDLDNATWVFTHSGYSLTGSTRYFISLELNGQWNAYQLPAGTINACLVPGPIRSTNSGASWLCNFATNTFALLMDLN